MIVSRTPLRISFLGGGTDYPSWFHSRPGAVLATTIDKYIYITCRYLPSFFDHTIRLSYSKIEHVSKVDGIEHPSIRECLRLLGIHSNVEIHTDSDLPARTGLGSSSSFTVGLLHALHAHQGRLVTKMHLAQQAIQVEQSMIRENVGCQDQILAAFGGLNRIDFSGGSPPLVAPFPMSEEQLETFEKHLLLFYTGIARDASEFAADQVRHFDRKVNELTEMYQLVDEGSRALLGNGDMKMFGELLHESWVLKRSLSPRISTPAIDEAYEVARNKGAYGGKLLGAGGGGFLLIFADPRCQEQIRETLGKLLHVPIRLDSTGSQIIFYQPNHANRR